MPHLTQPDVMKYSPPSGPVGLNEALAMIATKRNVATDKIFFHNTQKLYANTCLPLLNRQFATTYLTTKLYAELNLLSIECLLLSRRIFHI